jgi:hypothetical protein
MFCKSCRKIASLFLNANFAFTNSNYSLFRGYQKPVERVTWNEAKAFVYILVLILTLFASLVRK